MATDLSLRIILTAQDNTKAGLAAIKTMNDYMSNIAPAATVAGAALMAVGAATAYAVNAASDYQSSLLKVQAYAGMTAQETQQMSQQILQLAPQLGQAPKALADGLYSVASAGFKGADGLKVLKEAGMTAAAANVDAKTTSFALVSSLSALGLGANQSGNIMDALNATVKNGLMTWDQYGSVVGKIAGTVNVAGGSATMMQHNFTDLNAALDVYTNAGISAHQASMWLGADMTLLYGKAGSLATHANKLGLSFDAAKYSSMDFAQRVSYLTQVTGGNHDALVKLLGGNSQVANSVQFLSNNYKTWGGTITDINSKMQNGKTTQEMFNIAQKGAAFQAQQMQAAFQVLAITIGTRLLPVLAQILAAVTPMITRFTAWASTIQANSPVLAVLGGVLAGLAVIVMAAVVPALIAAAAGFLSISVAGAPLWIIIIAIIAVVTAAILVFQHWGEISKWLQTTWSAFTSWLKTTWGGIGAWFQGVLSGIEIFFRSTWNNIISTAKTAGTNVQNWFQGTFNNLKSTAQQGSNNLQVTFQSIWNGYVNGMMWMYNHNYYFKAAIDWLMKTTEQFKAWWQTAWTSVTTFLTTLWTTVSTWLQRTWLSIANVAQATWTTITTFIQVHVNQSVSWLQSTWNAAVAWLQSVWNMIATNASAGWAKVSTIFASAWATYISGPLATLWNQLSGWFGNLATQAVTWGRNMIQGLINGIQSMLGVVGAAAQNVMSTISSYLGFHSPAKMGEGRFIVQWGENAVKGFLQGMDNMQPRLHTQMQYMVPHGSGGNTTTISRGPTTVAVNVTMNGSGNTSNDASQLATMLGDHLRAQFGNL